MENRKFELAIGDIDAPPQRFTAPAPSRPDYLSCSTISSHLMSDERLHGLAGGAPPDKVGTEILRVQRSHMKGHPQQRKTRGQHAPCKFIELARPVRNYAARAREPVDDRHR